MSYRLALVVAALAVSSPATAQTELEQGLAGALKGCEEWVLNPASWSNGTGPFLSAIGLGETLALVDSAAEAQLPPKELRDANHYWRINSTADAGYMLVVSDRLPMCHITGGGNADLQPVTEAILASDDFQRRWEKIADRSRDDMTSTEYRNREENHFTMVVSRASAPGQRRDRVQVLATAMMKIDR